MTGATANLDAAAYLVESNVQLTVAALAKDAIFVHAGVVGWRNRAIVIPAPSFSGKSTLVVALVEAGAIYYSDEYAIFDSQGRVHPYRRHPKLRLPSGSKAVGGLSRSVVSDDSPDPIQLGLILMTRYEMGSRWTPERLTRGESLLGLLGNTVPVRERPEQSMQFLSKAVESAEGFASPRSEASGVAKQILDLLQ